MTLIPLRSWPTEDEDVAESADGLGECPATILAPKDLPPARGALARHCAWIASVEGELAKLHTGKSKLEADIARADDAKRGLDELVNRDARTLAERVKSGAEWALSQFGGQDVQDLDARLAASRHHAAIAEKALKTTQAEIARTTRLLVALQARKASLVNEAAKEAAEGYFQDYAAAAADLRESIIALSGLQTQPGAGSHDHIIVGWVPAGLDYPAPVRAHEVAASVRTWSAFRAALAEDPRADVNHYLKFD